MILAVYLLSSCKITSTLPALPTTWLLVTTIPEGSMMKPGTERDPVRLGSRHLRNRDGAGRSGSAARKSGAASHRMASSGTRATSPASGSSTIASAAAFCVTEIFTTAGDTFLTSGAKLWCCISAIGEVIVSGVRVAA